jgi:hypothetical protein
MWLTGESPFSSGEAPNFNYYIPIILNSDELYKPKLSSPDCPVISAQYFHFYLDTNDRYYRQCVGILSLRKSDDSEVAHL